MFENSTLESYKIIIVIKVVLVYDIEEIIEMEQYLHDLVEKKKKKALRKYE
jgi:hypothetical protein